MTSKRYPSRQETADALAEAFRIKRLPATIIGRDIERAGYVIVQGKSVDGFSFRRSVPNMAVVPIEPGIGVLLGRDHKRRLVILEPDIDAQLAVGIDPSVNNPADRLFYGATNQDTLHTLYCAALSTDTDPSMEVVIYPWMWRDIDGEWFELPEQRFNFTDLVPDANKHVLVALWVTDENTVDYTTSTPQALVDDIDITDVQECQTDDAKAWTSIRFWRLYGGMTRIMESDSWRDGRLLINTGNNNASSAGASTFGAGVIKTLASGVVDAGSDRHLIIAAETGTADDLIEITGLNVGDEVIIRADAGDTITVKNNDGGATDKTLLYNGADLDLTDDQTMKLVKTEEGKVVQYVDEKGSGGGSGNVVTVGTYAASRPASPSEGDLYLPTDGRFNEVYHSSAWMFNDAGKVFVKPSSLSWAWVNQSAASIASTVGCEHLYTSTSNGSAQGWNIRKKSSPTAPYVITVRIAPTQIQEAAVQMAIGFRESSSGKLALLMVYFASGVLPTIYAQDYTSPTATPSTNTGKTVAIVPEWLQIEDNNTNRIMSYSYDGINFIPFYTVGRTSFLTADEVGFCINPFNISAQVDLTLLAWIES